MLASAASSSALVLFLFSIVDLSRATEKTDWALQWLQRLALHAVNCFNQSGGGHLYLNETRSLPVSSAGTCNLRGLCGHSQINASLKATWDQIHGLGNFEAASLLDVTCFAALCRKKRRQEAKKFSAKASEVIQQLQHGLLKMFGALLNAYVRRILHNTPNIENRSIPSRNKNKQQQSPNQAVLQAGEQAEASPKQRVQVDLDTIWKLHEEAEESGISLETLLKTKKNEKQGGGSEHVARYWQAKIAAMYAARAAVSVDGIRLFNLVTDCSTFSAKETCVSALYSCERDLGVYLNAQAVKGNMVSPTELLLDESVERMVAIRKADRIATHRLLQALSHQLSMVSNHQLSIASFMVADSSDDFDHPLAPALQPLSPHHVRLVQRFQNGAFRSVRVLDKRTQL